MIATVYVFKGPKQMVMVFDELGDQMPEYQGPKEQVWWKIRRDITPAARVEHGVDYDTWARARGIR